MTDSHFLVPNVAATVSKPQLRIFNAAPAQHRNKSSGRTPHRARGRCHLLKMAPPNLIASVHQASSWMISDSTRRLLPARSVRRTWPAQATPLRSLRPASGGRIQLASIAIKCFAASQLVLVWGTTLLNALTISVLLGTISTVSRVLDAITASRRL